MDIVLLHASVLALPASHRADAIAYDGTVDLGLWKPPGPDRDLLQAYGDTLTAILAKERAQLAGGQLEPGQALRLHPGKLKTDYLIWVGGRPAHGKTDAAPAPTLAVLETLVQSALTLAGKHDAARVGFGGFGGGVGAADAAERMAAVVRGASAFRDACLQEGRSVPIEEVVVCSINAADVAKARRLTARLAREQPIAQSPSAQNPKAAKAPRATGAGSRSASSAGKRAASASSTAGRRPRAKRLDPADVSNARVRATPYDRGHIYGVGAWFLHPTFGMAQVQDVLSAERIVTALFEDGQERRLIHART